MSIEMKHRICLGADGCKDGWIVAVLDGDLKLERFPSIGSILRTNAINSSNIDQWLL